MKLELDGSKLLWHQPRLKQRLAGIRIAPITVDLALTRACNFKCGFCYSKHLQENPGAQLSMQEITNLFDDFAELGVKAVSLVSDGESTCHPDWESAIQYARFKGLDVALGTNGYLYMPAPRTQASLTYLRFNMSAARTDRYMQIHGVGQYEYDQVLENIREAVRLKRICGHKTTIGIQMVLLPQYIDQALALAYMGKALGVDYTIIKHCSDDETGKLGVRYADYDLMHDALRRAEKISDDHYKVVIKWSKILAGNKREYQHCYGPPFFLQLSGSGLVAPCGMFFGSKYFKYHIGSLHEKRFKEIWESERYWEVMSELSTSRFDASKMCGCLCIQDATNRLLDKIINHGQDSGMPDDPPPKHVNFI